MTANIIWKNTTSGPQSVHFDNFGRRLDSGPIPPGGTWTFHAATTGSITYHSTYDRRFRGRLLVQIADPSS
jgi:hypothetical protein